MHKSPSVKKRDRQRMLEYNLKNKEEIICREKLILENRMQDIQELQKKSNIIPHLKQIIMNLESKLCKAKPVLTFSNVSNHDIPPSSISRTYSAQPYHSTPTQPASVLEKGIPQLDGSGDPDVFHCLNCKKILETTDDFKWHYETEIGRQDF